MYGKVAIVFVSLLVFSWCAFSESRPQDPKFDLSLQGNDKIMVNRMLLVTKTCVMDHRGRCLPKSSRRYSSYKDYY